VPDRQRGSHNISPPLPQLSTPRTSMAVGCERCVTLHSPPDPAVLLHELVQDRPHRRLAEPQCQPWLPRPRGRAAGRSRGLQGRDTLGVILGQALCAKGRLIGILRRLTPNRHE
jgi:hypothetical protein